MSNSNKIGARAHLGVFLVALVASLWISGCGGDGSSSSSSDGAAAAPPPAAGPPPVVIPPPAAGNITAFVDATDANGAKVKVMSTGSSALGNFDVVTVGGTLYNRTFTVSNVTATDFIIVVPAFVGTEAIASWARRGGVNAATCTTATAGSITLPSTATIPNRFVGVAPLAVFFDATTVMAPAATTLRPFHDLGYQWTFGDTGPSAGAWGAGTGNTSKNQATGAIAAHVYETPGAYVVNLNVTDGSNSASATSCIEIAVQDPNVVFSGTNTVCFSNSTDHTGCPLGAFKVDSTTDFDGAVATQFGAGKRLLFHAGHTFTTPIGKALNAAGPNTVGAYPIGSSAMLNFPDVSASPNAAITTRDSINDLRIMDLEIAGAGANNTIGIGSDGFAPSKVTLLRLNVHDVNVPIKPFGTDEVVVQDSTIFSLSGVPGSNSAHGIMFGQSRLKTGTTLLNKYTAVLGNSINLGAVSHGQVFGVRGELARWAVISNNTIDPGPLATFGTIKLATIKTFAADADITKFVIVSDNLLVGGVKAFGVIGTGANSAGLDERSQDIIVERNWFHGAPGGNTTSHPMMTVAAPDTTVRNNLFDARKGFTTGAFAVKVLFVGLGGTSPPVTNVSVYHNSFFTDDAATANELQAVRVEGPVTVDVKNNLAYFPLATGVFMIKDASGGLATITASKNSGTAPEGGDIGLLTTDPFAATPPTTVNISTTANAWKPTGYALGAGTAVPVWSDFRLPFVALPAGPRDMGAVRP